MLIAIAGDDAKFAAQLQPLLEAQNHQVLVIPSGAPLVETLRASAAHLLVMIPSAESAKTACAALSSIRSEASLRKVPILCVNPRAGSKDGVAWLDAGADDFVNRPFDPAIFQARVRTLLRRRVWAGTLEEAAQTTLSRGPLSLKLLTRQAFLDGKLITLTRLEFDLLAHLMKSPAAQATSRQDLLTAVWNYPQEVETRTLDKHVETLRRKLGSSGELIETVHGVGYRLADAAPRTRQRIS